MRLLFWAAFALIVSSTHVCFGQSGKKTPEQKNVNTQQAIPADQRGTEQLPAIVKILPATKTTEEAEADRQEKASKNAADWWLIKLTAALAIIGTLQLVVFGWQGIQLARTVTVSKRKTTATINAESPRLLYLGCKLVRYDGVDGPGIEDPISGSPYGIIRPVFMIKNGGRTLLTINQMCVEWLVERALPERPRYANTVGVAMHLEQSAQNWLIDENSHIELSDGEIEKIQLGEAHLWVYGFFNYINHLTDEMITVGFGARWNSHAALFVEQAPPPYVYATRAPNPGAFAR
jgi:hypothetical protein